MYAKIENEETKQVSVGLGTNTEFYKSIGMVEMDVEQAYNGGWYLKGYAPEKPAPTKEEVSETRRQLFTEQADPLKYAYEECLARYGEDDQRTVDAKNAWLSKKDEIRDNNPYPVEEAENATETA